MASRSEPATESKPLVKLTIFFNKIWLEHHGPLFRSIPVVQANLVKYNQYHCNLSWRKEVASLGIPALEYDGSAEFSAVDIETLLAVFKDPEYLQIVAPDSNRFCQLHDAKFMVGYEKPIMDRTEVLGQSFQAMQT